MIPCESQKAQQKRKMKKERKPPHVRIKDLKRKKKNLFPQILFQNLDILLFTVTVIFNHSPQEIIQLPYSCF